MSSATLCNLSWLEPDQCAHCRHQAGGPDPYSVEQLDDLGPGRATRGGRPLELGAAPDSIIARWKAVHGSRCGWCDGPISKGQVVGMDQAGVTVCPSCLPDTGGIGGGNPTWREPRGPVPVPVPIPDLLERTARVVGGPSHSAVAEGKPGA